MEGPRPTKQRAASSKYPLRMIVSHTYRIVRQLKFSINNHAVAVELVNKEICHGRVFYTVGHNMLEVACEHSKGL